MITRYLKAKFRTRRSDDAGCPIDRIWINGKSISALIKPDSGKLLRVLVTERVRKRPVGPFWVGKRDEVALIHPQSGRALAYIWHDGYGKYYPTVYVSPFRALWISRNHHGFLVSLLSLPRCAMELVRVRSMHDAQACVQHVLQGGKS